MEQMIKLPSGIGDVLWVLQAYEIPKDALIGIQHGGPNGRASQLLALLGYHNLGEWHGQLSEATYEMNTWLEKGQRIEMKTGRADRGMVLDLSSAEKIPTKKKGRKWCGIYASSEKMQGLWGGWNSGTWAQFIATLPPEYDAVYFGAAYDIDAPEGCKYDLKDANLATTVKAMQRCDAFVGFPSGIPILAEYFDIPTIMFTPLKLERLQNTFCRIDKINTPLWKSCRFPTVEAINQWIAKTNFFNQL